MDVIAHGLWGGAFFGRKDKPHWRAAFLLGAAPDVLAFGPFLVTQIGSSDWVDFPRYVHQSYDVTHSLVVWAAVTGLVWLLRKSKSFPWIMAAWALHILCDIPLHSTDFFPTPYLWPLSTPLYNGTPWARQTFIIANYTALAVTYFVLTGIQRRQNRKTS
jgi:membrane-bound metal-dependent hydrolase YbcI (DUF457 family)